MSPRLELQSQPKGTGLGRCRFNQLCVLGSRMSRDVELEILGAHSQARCSELPAPGVGSQLPPSVSPHPHSEAVQTLCPVKSILTLLLTLTRAGN